MYNIKHNIIKKIYIYIGTSPSPIDQIMETFFVIPPPTKVPAKQSRQQALEWQRSNEVATKQWIHNSCRARPARSRALEALQAFLQWQIATPVSHPSAVSVKCVSISHECTSALLWMAILQSKWLTSWVLRFIEYTHISILTFRIRYTHGHGFLRIAF